MKPRRCCLWVFLFAFCWMFPCISADKDLLGTLKPVSADAVAKLRKAGWQIDDSTEIPFGWYIGKSGVKKPEYKVIKSENAKTQIFIRGGFAVDATVIKQDPSHELALLEFNGKGICEGANFIFHLVLIDPKGKTLGNASSAFRMTRDWKPYVLKLRIPKRPDGIKTKITPGFYSPEGVYMENVRIKTVPATDSAQQIPQKKNAILDFDFTHVEGKTEIQDRTGNYTLYSDCGKLKEEHHALRVSQGARFRIPCKNDAFGEKFTISAWILKASLGGIFHTPILSRGWQKPIIFLGPVKGQFDFAFYVDVRLPAFATGNGGGLLTDGYYYNMNIKYLKPEYLKAKNNFPLELNTWQQVTAVYDSGAVRVYLNGAQVGENPNRSDKKLLTSGLDLYLGAHRVKGERDNKITAEMLIKSIRVVGRALSAEEIAADFAEEKKLMPFGESFPDLIRTRAYFPEDMKALDPAMKNRLRQTAAFKKKLPSDPFTGKKNISTRLESSPGKGLRLYIDGKVEAPVNGHGHINDNDHRLGEFVSDFAAAGVDLAGLGNPGVWVGIGKYDWKELDRRLALYIKTNPRCKIDVVLGTTPPAWYRKQFPEEQEEYYVNWQRPEKKRWTGHGGLLGSDRYLKDSVRMIEDIVRHIENGPYAAHVYGYLITGGDAGEWYWPGQFAGGGSATGYSAPTRKAFRDWVRRRYNNDVSALRKAWNDPQLDFDKVELPLPKERFASENLFFRDPVRAAAVIDCRKFYQERTAMNAISYIKAIRRAAPGKQITTYYGYPMLYAGNPALAFSGLQTVSDILKCPELNWIATPIDYNQRRGGDAGANIAGYIGSAKLHGKGIWREEDIRTHLFERLTSGRTGSLRETCEVLRRAYAYTIADDYGFWYICQCGLHGYHQNEVMEDAARMKKIADEAARTDRRDISEVAIVFDEKDSLNFLAPKTSGNDFVSECIYCVFRKLHRMGAPFKLYFIDDLSDPKMPDYKLYIFLNQWSANAEQISAIHLKLAKNHATAFWCYAPGYLDGKRFSTDNMKKLTGFDFLEERAMRHLSTTFDPAGKFAKLPALEAPAAGPVFSAKPGKGVQIVGRCGKYNTAAVLDLPDFRSVWSLLPPNREMLTALCELAGVHVYSRDGATLLANDSYVAIHSADTKPVEIKLPRKGNVVECISQKEYGAADRIKFTPEYVGQTAIFKIK